MKRLKILSWSAIPALLLVAMVSVGARTKGAEDFDAGAFYKAKCVACHGQKAEKKFDTTLTDEQLIDAVINGKKPEKPPNMPGYGEKGVTAEQAKALVEQMKQLKSAR